MMLDEGVCKHGNRHYCGLCLGETGEGAVPPPSPSREDLTALREADQATIASLGLVNKELADALAAALPLLDDSCPSASRARQRKMKAASTAARMALRSAGRLPAQKGEPNV